MRSQKILKVHNNSIWSVSLFLLGVTFLGLQPSQALGQTPSQGQLLQNIEHSVFLSAESELDKTEHQISRLIQISPDSSRLHYLMSSLTLRMYLRDPSDASLLRQSASLAAQAYELEPQSDFGIVALANILDVNGETDKGVALLQEAEKKSRISKSWRFWFTKAKLLTGIERTSKQLEAYKAILRDKNAIRKVIAPFVLATLLTQPEDEHASEKISEFNLEFPCSEFSLALSGLELAKGRINEAKRVLKELLSIEPMNAEASIRMASIELSKFRNPKSAFNYLKNIKQADIPPNFLNEFFMTSALVSIENQTFKVDWDVMGNAVRTSKDRDASIEAIAKAFAFRKRYSDSITFLEFSQIQTPGLASSYGILAEIHLNQTKDYSKAKQYFTDALALKTDYPRYFSGRGLANYNLKNLVQAQNDFESAVQLDPSDGSAHYNLACVLALTSKVQEALESLKTAISIDQSLAIAAKRDRDFVTLKQSPEFKMILESSENQNRLAH